MELELKHLAPYLPYGLQVKHKIDTTFTLLSIRSDKDTCLIKVNRDMPNGAYWNDTPISDIKPLLVPTSSLYTEMEDGKVPIVELAKMAGCNINMIKLPINEIETINIAKNNEVEFKYSSGYHRYFIFRNGSFYYKTGHDRRYGQDYETLKQSSQIELFTYLFEHHFDVFSLIDKGLALDKTKIK